MYTLTEQPITTGRMSRHGIIRILAAVLTALVLVLSGCAEDSEPDEAAGDEPSTDEDPAPDDADEPESEPEEEPEEEAMGRSYDGETITIITSGGSGGTFDVIPRLAARHLGRHIEGNPDVIVENMPGAGHRVAANHLYNVVEPDGLTIGMVNPALYADQLLGEEGVEFEMDKFLFLGSAERGIRLSAMRTETGFTDADAIRSASQPPRVGHSGTGSAFFQMAALAEASIGAPIEKVAGFEGIGDLQLSMERGEIDGIMSLGEATTFLDEWVGDGFITLILQTGLWNEESGEFERKDTFSDVPTHWEVADADTRPVLELALKPIEPVRPYFLPPGTPDDIVEQLREALWATFHDPEYLEEAEGIFGQDPANLHPMPGEDLQRVMVDAQAAPADLIEELRAVLGG